MGFSLIILVGLLGVLAIILFKNPIIQGLGTNNKLVNQLKHKAWIQNQWLCGAFLFFVNAVLFFSTGLILYGITFLSIPFIHLGVMIMAVILSVIFWSSVNLAWEGEKKKRLMMAGVGSSFYLILSAIFIYRLVTLEPSYPGEDTFMAAIGMMFGIIVTSVAFLTCFIMTGSKRKVA
ncbi:hypothetical protein ACFYKX_04515 [Cytobacillus sp. FJAT-54145]|uniref:Uncharacterized protein n=1 Tax=Cytobacillus spartinae TaxID=3299023 RepID=A0ABW6K6T2_9BACI